MTTGLLFGSDQMVAAWFYDSMGYPHYKYDRAVGLIADDKLVGAVLFHNWNGQNVEISYYGKKTITVGILRSLARFAVQVFNPSRVTLITSKRNKHIMRALQKIGFKLEGTQRCFYGRKDTIRNMGVRFVAFHDAIVDCARLSPPDVKHPAA